MHHVNSRFNYKEFTNGVFTAGDSKFLYSVGSGDIGFGLRKVMGHLFVEKETFWRKRKKWVPIHWSWFSDVGPYSSKEDAVKDATRILHMEVDNFKVKYEHDQALK